MRWQAGQQLHHPQQLLKAAANCPLAGLIQLFIALPSTRVEIKDAIPLSGAFAANRKELSSNLLPVVHSKVAHSKAAQSRQELLT